MSDRGTRKRSPSRRTSSSSSCLRLRMFIFLSSTDCSTTVDVRLQPRAAPSFDAVFVVGVVPLHPPHRDIVPSVLPGDGGHAGDRVREIVVGAGRMIDTVAA